MNRPPPALLILPLLPFAVLRDADTVALENTALRRTWSIAGGRIKTVALDNRLAGKSSVPTACDEFRIRISDGPDVGNHTRTLTAADFTLDGVDRETVGNVDALVFRLSHPDLKAELKVSLEKDAFRLRKQLVLTALRSLVLERIDPEVLALPGAEQPYRLREITADAPYRWKPGPGQPLYGRTDGTFWGVAFPAADNTVTGPVLDCGYLYGRRPDAGARYVAHPGVMGVADDPAFVEDAFFDYIDRTRARPFRLQVQYNCRFDFGPGVTRESFAKSVATIDTELVRKRGGAPFDAYVIDDGREDNAASWQHRVRPVNRKLDADFAGSLEAVKNARSTLGPRLSPGMNFGAGEFKPDDKRLNAAKYDELKTYYLAAGTERPMSLFDRLGNINPRLYIVISNGAYLSPWWLQHVDASWMINAGDAAEGDGRTGEPIYRDSILHDLAVKERTQFPLNAVFNHEPKKTSSKEAPDVFRRYLYMALSRGTGFLELYLKPAALGAPEWGVPAEGLKWVRRAGSDFRRVRMHGGDPRRGAVYGFTGWSFKSGYVSVHNPAGKPQTYRFTLDRAFGLVPASVPFAVGSPLPGSPDGLKPSYAYGDTVTITLPPHGVAILDFAASSEPARS